MIGVYLAGFKDVSDMTASNAGNVRLLRISFRILKRRCIIKPFHHMKYEVPMMVLDYGLIGCDMS
jgi:hypothetical protein